MLRRHLVRQNALVSVAGVITRAGHMPGWKTQTSTRDARTRAQREADRKVRQIEKLPRPEALHDFQYPYEKTILSDSMFQFPVYDSELDTPHLFNLTPPPDFFLYWNVSDFERTAYPAVPAHDHRLLVPSSASPMWLEHRARAAKYLSKHEIVPQYIPRVQHEVNLSVVFPGRYNTRARVDDDTGEPLPPPPPERKLTTKNFWFTAHCGNYIELTDLQQPPAIFFATEKEEDKPAYYTLLILSPDYPYRVPSYADRHQPNRGFFLNYMVANLPGGTSPKPPAVVVDGKVVESASLEKAGDVVIPYVPPLPTEDAGTTRHLCLLFTQTRHVSVTPLTPERAAAVFDLAERSRFRLHDPARADGRLPAGLAALRAAERVLSAEPRAVTFFQTKWDIQVQQFYERARLPEPAAPVDEEIMALLEFHSRRPEELRVRARHRPDGSTNIGDDPSFWGQQEPTRVMDGSMQALWSSRTSMGANGVPVVFPRP